MNILKITLLLISFILILQIAVEQVEVTGGVITSDYIGNKAGENYTMTTATNTALGVIAGKNGTSSSVNTIIG